jgi:UDP-N-acetylmuramate--alanine ligase
VPERPDATSADSDGRLGPGVAVSERLTAVQRVHMIGIGGAGMSALATLLLQMGKRVSGSELSSRPTVESLRAAGAVVFGDHAAEHVGEAEYVIRSSAVSAQNPEVAEAERLGLPSKKLAEAVGELMAERSGIAVAGTHGKTTTTLLVAWLLDRGGMDPLALIGADTPSFPLGARLGDGPMVVEADEYDRRFLNYWPEVAIVTSVEADHLDYFKDLAEIREVFQTLVERLPEHGRLVVCADEPSAAALSSPARRESYGFASDADWRISDYVPLAGQGAHFRLHAEGREWPVESPLVGEHNARNVAAAIAVADHFGIGLRAALAALATFQGPRRRFETKGRPGGVWVVDDYGHHPTEVAAVLRAAAAAAEGEVWVVFQPHTTNRTAALLEDFGRSFGQAQHALILPIYLPSGRESAARAVTSDDVVAAIRGTGHSSARAVASFDEAEAVVVAGAQPGDIVLTMGAGDVTLLAARLVEALGGRA